MGFGAAWGKGSQIIGEIVESKAVLKQSTEFIVFGVMKSGKFRFLEAVFGVTEITSAGESGVFRAVIGEWSISEACAGWHYQIWVFSDEK